MTDMFLLQGGIQGIDFNVKIAKLNLTLAQSHKEP